MKTFYILWTYIGNYSKLLKMQAESALSAQRVITDYFSPDFRAKASVFVFDTPPAHIYHRGMQIEDFETYAARVSEER